MEIKYRNQKYVLKSEIHTKFDITILELMYSQFNLSYRSRLRSICVPGKGKSM